MIKELEEVSLPSHLLTVSVRTTRCLLDQLENVGDHKFFFDGDDEERKECLPACKEQRHYLAISQSKFPSKQTFHLSEFSQLILRRLIHACAGDRRRSLDRYKPQLCRSLEAVMESENGSLTWAYYRFRHGSEEKDERLAQLRRDLSDYASDNLVSLYVYLKDPVVKRFLTREKISWVSFVGSIGGVLGLFSGFSVISLIELVYLTSIFRKE